MTRTLRLSLHSGDPAADRAALEQAATILREGGTVAFPTETVYGLGANALDADAVQKIFLAKQRPNWDPLIVHLASETMLQQVATSITEAERSLMEEFWPGPLTFLLPRHERIPPLVTAGRPKVGVRMPAHPVARALIELAGIPIAAPSANSFGRISPTTANHVLEDLDGRIDAVLDGGPTTLGLESTVIDANASPPVLFRHGMISLEDLQCKLCDLVAFDESTIREKQAPASLPSPGVGIRHYAPRAKLGLIEAEDLPRAVQRAIDQAVEKPIGVLLPDDFELAGNSDVAIVRWGRWTHPEELAQRLFAGLRALDSLNLALILCPLPENIGVGAALRDRLRKASKTGT